MSCGKKRLVKNWDRPRKLKVVIPSRFEQNEASVKEHWHKVVRDMELSYQDDQFWESQCDTVRELLGPKIFRQVAKIFNLPLEATTYQPQSETSSILSSENFYQTMKVSLYDETKPRSISSGIGRGEEEEIEAEENVAEEESEFWSGSTISAKTIPQDKSTSGRFKSSYSKVGMSKIMTKSFSKHFSRSVLQMPSKPKLLRSEPSAVSEVHTNDDLDVQHSVGSRRPHLLHRGKNPHFDMLYCNESETDMIKWKSKYKQKQFSVSASDEMSKKAEIITKQIAHDFYEWWVGLGNVEFKSEIKRPEDIESLFQIWFDEHSSRSLMLHPKILPCVLPSIADYTGEVESSCPNLLKRQVLWDVNAETTPAHLRAFGTSLPHKLKHIPPDNKTKEMWDCVKIPEDLRTMSCVFDDITHLTSTKAFQKWLEERPHLPMPLCFTSKGTEKHIPFLVPSDFIFKDKNVSESSTKDLALPVSQFSLELKEVLSKLMNQ